MNAMQRIKFGLSLMFPESDYAEVLRQMFAALEAANRRVFPDANALRAVLAGVVFNFGENPDSVPSKPPLGITWAFAMADNFLAVIPKAIEYPSEVLPHSKNVQLAQYQLAGINLNSLSLTVGELASFLETDTEKRPTSMAYIRAEIGRGNLKAEKLVDYDEKSPLIISVDEARQWLLNPKRGSRKDKHEQHS